MSANRLVTRREFLGAAMAGALGARMAWAAELSRDVRITRIVSFDLLSRRNKYIGKNARRGDHGIDNTERMIRIYTNAGLEGLGTSWDTRETCQAILGKRLTDLYRPDDRQMAGPFKRYTSPFWDLAGRVLGKPVYELLGGAGPQRVAAYDGSIYFVDLLSDHAHDWRDEFKRQLDLGWRAGHAAFKVKIGRGGKWMTRDEGDARDVDVVRLIRKHVGPDVLLAVDANDGYDLPHAKRFLLETADQKLDWIEEIVPVKNDRFPEYLELKAFLREHKLEIRIADGENGRRPDDYANWVKERAVDILQGDMNLFGFEDVLAMGRLGEPAGVRIAPHNWGSWVAYYLELHVGRAIKNFYRAEQDPMTSPAIVAEGYTLKDGVATVPSTPGLGLRIDEKRFAEGAKVLFDLKVQ